KLVVEVLEVFEIDLARSRVLIERPGTEAFDGDAALAKLAHSQDRGEFGKIEFRTVVAFDSGTTIVAQRAFKAQLGASGIPGEGLDVGGALSKGELGSSGPGKRLVVLNAAVDPSQDDVTLVATAKKGIRQISGYVVGVEIERNFLIVPDKLPAAHGELIHVE